MIKRSTALAVAVLVLTVFAPAASADPLKAKNSLAFPVTCDDGQTMQVVLNGEGEFTPAHVVGSTATFVPQALDITFEFTPTGGMTETERIAGRHPSRVCGAAKESNLPSVGLPRPAGFEGRMSHQTRAAPRLA